MKRDFTGSILGIITFLAGVGLLLLTFRMALEMFGAPPAEALGLERGKPMDLGVTGAAAAGILIRILLLLVMGFVGSLISNRGILLFAKSLHPLPTKASDERVD